MSRYFQYDDDRGNDRYNRQRSYNTSHNQPSGFSSDMRYDEHYGQDDRSYDRDRRSGGGGGGGRSVTNYDRDMRQQSRGREDRRSGGGGGGSFRGGASQMSTGGLLGASPSETIPNPSGNVLGGSAQQQVLAALQTQNLLAALQAQQISSMGPASLLPTPGSGMVNQRGNRGSGDNYSDRSRQRKYQQPKRRNQHDQGPMNKRKRDESAGHRGPSKQVEQRKPFRPAASKQEVPKEPKQKNAEGEEDDVYEIIDDEQEPQGEAEDIEDVEIVPEMIEKVEELRKRTKVDRNIADQDVDKLAVFHFDGQTYRCELCKIVARRIKSIKQHFMGKKHSLSVIEARQAGNDVDRDISDIILHPESWLEMNPVAKTILKKQTLGFMEAKKKEEEEYRYKHPENFLTYRLDTRKSAMKDGDTIVITSVCEANVAIKGFDSDKQMFGCEFIKATTGFNCRLCNVTVHTGEAVVEHIRTDEHMSNYKSQLEKHGGYHDKLVRRNKEIVSLLEQHEGSEVVMYEAFEEQTENQKLIRRRYVQPEDPDFIRIENQIPEMNSKDEEGKENGADDDEADADANETGNTEEQQHEEDETSDAILEDHENIEEGDQRYDEDVDLEDSELYESKPEEEAQFETENHHDQVEEDEEPLNAGEELYEPSEPTIEQEMQAEDMEEQLEEKPQPVVEVAPVVKKEPVTKPRPAVKVEQINKQDENKVAKTSVQKKKVVQKPAQAQTQKVNKQRGLLSPPTAKPKGRAGKALARSSRGGRVSQRSPKVMKGKSAANTEDDSFEVIDEVGAGDEE